jgi:hypothetical protein
VLESRVDFVRIELVTFSNRFAEEIEPSFLRKSRDRVSWN